MAPSTTCVVLPDSPCSAHSNEYELMIASQVSRFVPKSDAKILNVQLTGAVFGRVGRRSPGDYPEEAQAE